MHWHVNTFASYNSLSAAKHRRKLVPANEIQDRLNTAIELWKTGGPESFSTVISSNHMENDPFEATYNFVERNNTTEIWVAACGKQLQLGVPMPLLEVKIDKPWGNEIWFTGMESRGETQIKTPQGPLPLSKYLALAPLTIHGGQPIVLVKQLNPISKPLLGDLYLEAHRIKHEVYVVTNIDRSAWPSGRAKIRLGINQRLRSEYSEDQDFREDYLKAVDSYEAHTRHDIKTEASLRRAEELRLNMNRFTQLQTIVEGTVVDVPPLFPHSLPHGVQVIEFQTPTYERMVIAASQPVVTQEQWDSSEAINKIHTGSIKVSKAPLTKKKIAPISSPFGFQTWIVTLEPNEEILFDPNLAYAITFTLSGVVDVGGLIQQNHKAIFVPRPSLPLPLKNIGDHTAYCLVSGAPALTTTK
tara:strand:+ start:159 stop:1400 length:1242 start_codon:yes stop_codon:yes gene_type:complete